MTVVYPLFPQTPAGGFDDLDGLVFKGDLSLSPAGTRPWSLQRWLNQSCWRIRLTILIELIFHKNNCNADFIKRNIYRPTEADATIRNPTPLTTVTIPYIKGTSETISRILQPYNIRLAHKPQLRYDNY